MKIAITGHSSGIGRALSTVLSRQGHEIIGLSRRNGFNIRSIPKVADQIESCDMFINNAQAGYAQTELLFEMSNRWKFTNKHIIVIGTIMTQHPISSLPGLDMDHYRVQKIALEEAVRQLRFRNLGFKLTMIRPGNIATDPSKTVPPAADVDNWANTLIDIFELAQQRQLRINEINLGPL